jgi:hypothetical protein
MMFTSVGSTVPVVAALLLALVVQSNLKAAADTQLKQIHVINRHGSRTMFPKDAVTLIEEDDATLTPLGQSQLFNLGSWLRQTYLGQLVHVSLKYLLPGRGGYAFR